MEDFLRFIDNLTGRLALHLEIGYNKTCDWEIMVYRKGCADEYPEGAPTCNSGNDALMCCVSDSDMELCFARAHVAVKDWLMDYHDGY